MSEEKAVTIRDSKDRAIGLSPQTAEEAYRLSTHLAKSDLCPKSFGQNPANVFAAIMMGAEIGVGPMQAMANIAVVNGRASMWGELVSGLIWGSGICEKLEDKVTGKGDDLAVTVTTKRKGVAEYSYTFSWEDAKLAGLTAKDTYQKYRKDMLYWKALGRVSKRYWADVLKGITIREIADDGDLKEEFPGAVEVEATTAQAAEAPAPAPAPAEPTVEELAKKAEEARARVAAKEAKEKAKAEKKEKKAAAPAKEAVTAPESAEEELGAAEEPAVEAVPVNRAIGTLMTAVRLTDPKTALALGFAIKMQTANGDLKFKMASEAEARAAKAFVNKTVEVIWEKLETPIDGVVGQCAKLTPVNP
jgi:hypothetical protein